MRIICTSLVIALALACNSEQDSDKQIADVGKDIFKAYCIVCHGINGKLGLNGAKDLSLSSLTYEEQIQVIKKGRNAMAAFEGILNEDQIKAVADYVQSLKQNQ